MSIKYLLDTNIISELMRPIPNLTVAQKHSIFQKEVATASVVIHELLYGCQKLQTSKKQQFLFDYISQIPHKMPIFDYNLDSAKWHAEQRARLSKIGKNHPFIDGQIASISACNSLTLVTNNVSDFENFEGLKIENWFIP